MKKVKLVRLGGHGTVDIEVEDGATLREAALKAGVEIDGMSVRISGEAAIAPGDKLPADREIVVLTVAPKVEGGGLADWELLYMQPVDPPVEHSPNCLPEECDGWRQGLYYGWTPVRNSGFLG